MPFLFKAALFADTFFSYPNVGIPPSQKLFLFLVENVFAPIMTDLFLVALQIIDTLIVFSVKTKA